jgi:hypothetical protein
MKFISQSRAPSPSNSKNTNAAKKVYLCGRWEINREGEKGHFGDVVEAFIP